MKKKFKILALILCLVFFGIMAIGTCSSTDSTATKVGEVSDESNSDESNSDESNSDESNSDESNSEGDNDSESDSNSEDETSETDSSENASSKEEKTVFHVGDILMDGNVQIVYVASGEYKEDNDLMQPKDGNKLVFIKLAFENQGDSDEAISSFSFEAYADGYNAEAHYTENDLAATLSKGRSTEGILVYEVAEDAQEIEIEYETNFFKENKITFVYDGEKDSGYTAKADTAASESAFAVGDIIESKDLNISYLSCENDKSYNDFSAPNSGFHYITLTFEFENKGNTDEFVSYFDFDCYADGANCEMAYFRDDSISATISPGRKAKGTVTFAVPDEATIVEVEYESNSWTDERLIFAATE